MRKKTHNHLYKLATYSFSLLIISSSYTPSYSAFKSLDYNDCVRRCTHDTNIQKECVGTVRNSGKKTMNLIQGFCGRKHGAYLNEILM